MASWIKKLKLVSPLEFDLAHDHTVPLCCEKNGFNDYSANFEALGFSVWNVENDYEMTCRVKIIVQRNDRSRVCDLGGRPDFIRYHAYKGAVCLAVALKLSPPG